VDITLLRAVTSSELSMAPGRTLATMLFTVSAIVMSDVDVDDDRPPDISSEALMMTPVDTVDGRGTVVYLPTATSLFVEFDVTVSADNETSSLSELVQLDSDGGHSDSEPARQ